MLTWLNERKSAAKHRSRYTTLSCDVVVKRLSNSIGRYRWSPSEAARTTAEVLKAEIELKTGPHGFMLFSVIDQGYTLHTLNAESDYTPSFRFILGNPLLNACIQEIDGAAGLYVPVEMLVQEKILHRGLHAGFNNRIPTWIDKEQAGTVVSYVLPSSLIAPKEKAFSMKQPEYECLLQAATNLDKMFETLVEYICAPEDALQGVL